MRFEFFSGTNSEQHKLHENKNVSVCDGATNLYQNSFVPCGGCGSYGLNSNSDETTKPPCLIMVDVNGDRKPNPSNLNCKSYECAKPYKLSDPKGIKLTDLFSIMITDKKAIPYGTAAQRAMYQARK